MNIKDFNEALYASSNGVVTERRKNIIKPLSILFIGLALLLLNNFIENGDDANNLKSTIVLIGGFTTLIGVVMCSINIFGTGTPYHTGDKSPLKRKQYSFECSQRDSVIKAVEACDKLALDIIEESDIAGISVVCYYSPCSRYCVMQAFAYEDFTYKSITDMVTKE